jgi:hypothetical protein
VPRWRGGTFIWSPDQHRQRADQLEHQVATRGDPGVTIVPLLEFARHHRNLATLIEGRQRTGVVAFGRAQAYVASPPLSPYGRFRSD